MKIKDLDELKVNDVYSLILFALYKFQNIPQYSTLSELSYLLNKESLLNLLEYYGGTTIKIPTLSEFKVILNALLLYEYTKLENIEYNTAVKLISKNGIPLYETKAAYIHLCELLDKYNFKRE